jgi:glycosyltransferase involved in cell wall biosynthesis
VILSVVVPVFNEEEVIETFVARLNEVINGIEGVSAEVILVDDGSTDRSGEFCRSIAAVDIRYRYIKFARNFGHQAALFAGLRVSCGDAVVFIDSDLQDPPELIPVLLEEWRRGAKVVHAQRVTRSGESRFKLWSAATFYRVLNRLSDVDLPENVGDFRLIDRRVADIVSELDERSLYLRGLFAWVGFEQATVPYHRSERVAGETKYPLSRMVRLGSDAIISFSEKPLRLMTKGGIFLSTLSFSFGVSLLLFSVFSSVATAPGWLSIVLLTLFLSGVQMFLLGLVGEYVTRIFHQVKGRPLYIIEEIEGID